LQVIATDLNNPRKIFLGQDGAIYVTEAGTGGNAECFGTGSNKVCIGLTGSITRIVGHVETRVVTGLVSFGAPNGRAAQGPTDVLVRGGRYDILLRTTRSTRSAPTVSGRTGCLPVI
jgi:hypothetical protein